MFHLNHIWRKLNFIRKFYDGILLGNFKRSRSFNNKIAQTFEGIDIVVCTSVILKFKQTGNEISSEFSNFWIIQDILNISIVSISFLFGDLDTKEQKKS